MLDPEKAAVLKKVYSDLPPEQKTRLLSLLALNITVSARGSYPSQETENDTDTVKNSLAEVIGFNEIQHTVTGQLASMIDNDENRYPDDVFLAILLEKAQNSYCEKGLLSALKFSYNRLGISLDGLWHL
jgi:hypothetical protein